MTFSILGDSISTFQGTIPQGFDCFFPREGYSVARKEQMWWSLFMEKTGHVLFLNDSYSGSRITKTGIEHEHSSAFIDRRRLSILPPSEMLFVFGGTNDFGQRCCQASLKRFRTAYRILVSSLARRNDIEGIWFFTPLIRTDYGLQQKNTRGWTQLDLAQTIRDEVKRNDSGKVHLVDLAAYQIRKGDGVLEDDLHPTVKGMEIVCSLVVQAIAT